VQTSQEDASTAGTTGGSVGISTKRGSDDWHGDEAFFIRAAALNARFPIENPAPLPKQPFSRQNYVGTIGGPISQGKVWFFSSVEFVNENASVAYSPNSLTQFNALAQLAAEGLIPGAPSIPVPDNVAVPFQDILADARVDWAQSARSQWFLRAALDHYHTNNDLVQQATLPSTGATSRSNYLNLAIGQQQIFSPTWLGSFTFDASGLHHTEDRTSTLGFALAFPFSSTAKTISGFETFGDNQFVTPITAFPVLRNQQKYQFRYDLTRATGDHALRFGISFIHEPVLSGALAATAENLTTFVLNPIDYLANPAQFSTDLVCGEGATDGTTCSNTPAGNGSFVQNVQRLGFYAQDSWRVTSRLTLNYGLRYDTTFGLFTASGRSQAENPAFLTLKALGVPLVNGVPHDYRGAFAPRLGIAYAPGKSAKTVLRAGVGLYYDDLAQNGWVGAFQAVNVPPGPCLVPTDSGCLPAGSQGALIDSHYHTPYALHATAGVQHAFNDKWTLGADWVHETGMHGYRHYVYNSGFTLPADAPNIDLYRSDNRSSYDAMFVHMQGTVTHHFSLTANYTLSSAKTWGCVLGELFDYVNGVCNPANAFGPGDYGPSGEDVLNRFVVAGTFYVPGGFQVTLLGQAEGARPITLTTPVDVNGFGDANDDRAVVNGVPTTLDQFRGTPYVQFDVRISRPIKFHERWTLEPFIEMFNIFNRNNPGANYVTNIAALTIPGTSNPLIPASEYGNITSVCTNSTCSQTAPLANVNQLLQPAGALGDFFGPGTTVGIPFAAQFGARFTF
jgi:hypothetical protein